MREEDNVMPASIASKKLVTGAKVAITSAREHQPALFREGTSCPRSRGQQREDREAHNLTNQSRSLNSCELIYRRRVGVGSGGKIST